MHSGRTKGGEPQACRPWGREVANLWGFVDKPFYRAHLRPSGGREDKNLTPSARSHGEAPRGDLTRLLRSTCSSRLAYQTARATRWTPHHTQSKTYWGKIDDSQRNTKEAFLYGLGIKALLSAGLPPSSLVGDIRRPGEI
jgi:hypothetical protein